MAPSGSDSKVWPKPEPFYSQLQESAVRNSDAQYVRAGARAPSSGTKRGLTADKSSTRALANVDRGLFIGN